MNLIGWLWTAVQTDNRSTSRQSSKNFQSGGCPDLGDVVFAKCKLRAVPAVRQGLKRALRRCRYARSHLAPRCYKCAPIGEALYNLAGASAGITRRFLEGDRAADQDMGNTNGVAGVTVAVAWNILNKILGATIDGGRVKDGDVGNVSWGEMPAILDPPNFGRLGGNLSDRRFKVEAFAVSNKF